MSIRLSIITTRTGDAGTTGLADGTRLDKDAARIVAIGEVDELNSTIGLLRAETLSQELDSLLARIQNDLFDLGSELCLPGNALFDPAHVAALDEAIKLHNAELPALSEFILPGGTRGAALAHMARTVCRRAERSLVRLHRETPISPAPLQYLNRLSDLCFIMARTINRQAGRPDVLWKR